MKACQECNLIFADDNYNVCPICGEPLEDCIVDPNYEQHHDRKHKRPQSYHRINRNYERQQSHYRTNRNEACSDGLQKRCSWCGGTGRVKDLFAVQITCPVCHGKCRNVFRSEPDLCDVCDGSGEDPEKKTAYGERVRCPYCKGKGWIV